MKKVSLLILVLVFSGCSTIRGPSHVNNLQIKIAQLERKVNERDQEITDLKYEVDRLSNEINSIQSFSRDSIEEPVFNVTADDAEIESQSSGTDERIIRVSADEKEVQQALKNAGYYKGAIDGKIGSGSKRAIVNFQKDHDLKADGIVGRKTWKELKTYID